jgi:zinc D-Ala-D-Ala carboxypeptidase
MMLTATGILPSTEKFAFVVDFATHDNGLVSADPTTLRLRAASAHDAEFIYRLVEQTMRGYVEKVWGAFSEDYNRRNIAATIAAKNYSIIQIDGAEAGAISFVRESTHIQLDQLFILPQHQNQGIGTRFLRLLQDEARSAAMPIRLRVLVGNPARRLYEKEGFRVTWTTPQRTYMEWAEAASECPARIRELLQSCGIAPGLVAARALALQLEAERLAIAEADAAGREHLLVPQAAAAWQRMKAAAAQAEVSIRIVSAFRSADRQAEIVRAKLARGLSVEDVLEVSAPPGYSEHHSGRAVDLTTDGVKPLESEFEGTPAYRWLCQNARLFGFRLSYPQGNAQGYAYEPWHWCFMGD